MCSQLSVLSWPLGLYVLLAPLPAAPRQAPVELDRSGRVLTQSETDRSKSIPPGRSLRSLGRLMTDDCPTVRRRFQV
jgi:hypothetical protein